VPCALAKPVPAISAAAATEIIKRLIIELFSSRLCIAHADNGRPRMMFRAITGSSGFIR
jgi:hypothetical protein